MGSWPGLPLETGTLVCSWTAAGGGRLKATPVGFEPTRGDPIGLAGRRLNRSAKVSLLRSAMELIWLLLPGNRVLWVEPQRYTLQQELRTTCRDGGSECGLLLSDSLRQRCAAQLAARCGQRRAVPYTHLAILSFLSLCFPMVFC